MDEPERLQAWAAERRIKHALWLGAIVGMIVLGVLAASLELRGRASLAGFGFAFQILLVTTLVGGFQTCPRCKKQWNMRGLFGFSSPYSPSCLNCSLRAPKTDRVAPSRLLTLFAATALPGPVIAIATHLFLPRPTVHEGVSVTAMEEFRGTQHYVAFVDGTPRTDLLGSDTTPKPAYHMVPLVPAAWTKADPVRVWIQCAGRCADPRRWTASLDEATASHTPLRNAKIVPHADVTKANTRWHRATRDAIGKHGITTDPRAIVVSWPHDPDRD